MRDGEWAELQRVTPLCECGRLGDTHRPRCAVLKLVAQKDEENARLKAAAEEREADTERLDWLEQTQLTMRDPVLWAMPVASPITKEWWMYGDGEDDQEFDIEGKSLREVIDAARTTLSPSEDSGDGAGGEEVDTGELVDPAIWPNNMERFKAMPEIEEEDPDDSEPLI